jgi:hypothetical protein
MRRRAVPGVSPVPSHLVTPTNLNGITHIAPLGTRGVTSVTGGSVSNHKETHVDVKMRYGPDRPVSHFHINIALFVYPIQINW